MDVCGNRIFNNAWLRQLTLKGVRKVISALEISNYKVSKRFLSWQ